MGIPLLGCGPRGLGSNRCRAIFLTYFITLLLFKLIFTNACVTPMFWFSLAHVMSSCFVKSTGEWLVYTHFLIWSHFVMIGPIWHHYTTFSRRREFWLFFCEYTFLAKSFYLWLPRTARGCFLLCTWWNQRIKGLIFWSRHVTKKGWY